MKSKLTTYGTALPAALLLQVGTSFAQAAGNGSDESYFWGHGMMWDSGNWGGFGFFLGPAFMVLVLVAIVAGILYLVRGLGQSSHQAQSDPTNTALAILNERFARGEIDLDEFEERRKQLLH